MIFLPTTPIPNAARSVNENLAKNVHRQGTRGAILVTLYCNGYPNEGDGTGVRRKLLIFQHEEAPYRWRTCQLHVDDDKCRCLLSF